MALRPYRKELCFLAQHNCSHDKCKACNFCFDKLYPHSTVIFFFCQSFITVFGNIKIAQYEGVSKSFRTES